jgi:hypothetical protein
VGRLVASTWCPCRPHQPAPQHDPGLVRLLRPQPAAPSSGAHSTRRSDKRQSTTLAGVRW